MPRASLGLLLTVISVAAPSPCRAEDPEPGLELTREQWIAHVREQRARIEQMRRERRSFVYEPPTQEQLADERVRQALDDPALVPGDVIVTRRGLFQYRGTPDDRERQPGDFVLIETPGRK